MQLPVKPLPERESEDELLTLYVADFLHSFQKALELPRLTVAELREGLSGDPEAASTALLRQAMFRLTSVRASALVGMLRLPSSYAAEPPLQINMLIFQPRAHRGHRAAQKNPVVCGGCVVCGLPGGVMPLGQMHGCGMCLTEHAAELLSIAGYQLADRARSARHRSRLPIEFGIELHSGLLVIFSQPYMHDMRP